MAELYVDPAIPRFTREELVAEMASRYGQFNDGTFRRWQEKGVIAAPVTDRRWQEGRPGSAPGLWSDNDRRMIDACLQLRERHSRSGKGSFEIAGLGNFVVWSWVYWDGYVTVGQARLALKTWTAPQVGGRAGKARSRDRMTRLARARVEQAAHPDTSKHARIKLASNLSEKLWNNDIAGVRALIPDMRKVMDPYGEGRRIGAPGADVGPEEELEALYLSHVAAEAVVTGKPATDDSLWEAARQVLRETWVHYQARQPLWQAVANIPEAFEEPTVDYQLARCSATLLMALGDQIVKHRT